MAVVGVPDPVWGEVGIAVCVPREGAAAVSELELAAFLAAKVPRYKMPKRFFFWEALPKSGYGKIPKRLVRDELEARGLLDGRREADRAECEASSSPARRRPSASSGSEARGRAFSFTLEAGVPLLEAARRGFAAAGICRRRAEHRGRGARPLRLCDAGAVEDRRQRRLLQRHLPARRRHAAEDRRDDLRRSATARRSFIATRCGREADGRAGGGHILPEETMVAEPFAVEAFGIDGAMFAAEPDPETNFKLFGPVPSRLPARAATSRAFALRLRPNQDFAGALEAFCRERGIAQRHDSRRRRQHHRRALCGRPESSSRSRPNSRSARASIAPGRRRAEAELDIALVDYTGGLAEGRLKRGDNPVLMTMELVLEVMR